MFLKMFIVDYDMVTIINAYTGWYWIIKNNEG